MKLKFCSLTSTMIQQLVAVPCIKRTNVSVDESILNYLYNTIWVTKAWYNGSLSLTHLPVWCVSVQVMKYNRWHSDPLCNYQIINSSSLSFVTYGYKDGHLIIIKHNNKGHLKCGFRFKVGLAESIGRLKWSCPQN